MSLQTAAHARAESAALELFIEKGYEQTTVDDIVEVAGISRRSFFRWFSTKREVLYWGHELLAEAQAAAVSAAPEGSSPLQMAAAALHAVADIHAPRRKVIRRRQLVVAAVVELQERQLLKNRQLAERLAAAMEQRGAGAVAASVTATAAIGAYSLAFGSWAEGRSEDLHASVTEVVEALAALGGR